MKEYCIYDEKSTCELSVEKKVKQFKRWMSRAAYVRLINRMYDMEKNENVKQN